MLLSILVTMQTHLYDRANKTSTNQIKSNQVHVMRVYKSVCESPLVAPMELCGSKLVGKRRSYVFSTPKSQSANYLF